MTDLIPPKARKIAGLVITLIVAVLAVAMEWQDMGAEFTRWTGRAFAMLVVVSNVLGLNVSAPKLVKGGAVSLLLLFLLTAGCNPNAAAWRTLDGVQRARAMTAQQLAMAGTARHKDCVDKHGTGTDGYKVCIEPTAKMLRHWQRDARPAIIAAVQVTASSLQIAEHVGGKDVGWIKLLSPGLCALSRVVKLYKHYLPDGGASIAGVVGMVEGVTCNGR